jgi:hypothetical protein
VSERRARLENLSRLTDRFPQTYWSPDSFARRVAKQRDRWWVRSLAEEPAERYRHTQGPWTDDEVETFFASLTPNMVCENAFVVQEFMEPFVAGASVTRASFVLSEGILGSAAPAAGGVPV